MADPDNSSRSNGERREPTRLAREISEADKMLNAKWAYDFYNNPGTNEAVKKAQYNLCSWKEELKESQELEDKKKADISELWTGVYQIVGFYSVFQGVIYQGVTAMSSMLSCGFYKIPVLLSVLASSATILGIYMKLTEMQNLSESLQKDANVTKELEIRIDMGYQCDVEHFSAEQIENRNSGKNMTAILALQKEASFKARLLQWAVLGFLAIFSALFTYLDYIVMCRGYS